MAYRSSIPSAVTRAYGPGIGHPVVAQEFVAGRGWKAPGWSKRITPSYARKLRAQGVEAVALRFTDAAGLARTADFRTSELSRRPACSRG